MSAILAERVQRALARLIVAGACVLACAAASAGAATTVGVVVDIAPFLEDRPSNTPADAASLAVNFNDAQRADIANKVATLFAEHLQTLFRHWDFTAGGDNAYAVLRVHVLESQNGAYRFRLLRSLPLVKPQPVELFAFEWVAAGSPVDPKIFGINTSAVTIAGALQRLDDLPQKQQLNDFLQQLVPIGKGGRWVDPAPESIDKLRLILALSQERFPDLADASLKVLGTRDASPLPVGMPMLGIAETQVVEIEAGHPVQGLVVCPGGGVDWERLDVNGARGLKITWILLEKEGSGLMLSAQ